MKKPLYGSQSLIFYSNRLMIRSRLSYKKWLSDKQGLKTSCIAIMLIAFGIPQIANAADIYIFKPSNEKATTVQEVIQGSCKDVNIIVFGRVKDFLKQVEAKKPSGIVSLLPVVKHHGDYNVVSKGSLDGATHDNYVLVSIDIPVDIAQIDTMKLGVIDILGRKGMTTYISDLFGKKIAIKRVTKTEDLAPLLTFKAVDALLITQTVFDTLKQSSELNFVSTKTELTIGLSTVATIQDDAKEAIEKCVSELPPEANTILGVQSWKF